MMCLPVPSPLCCYYLTAMMRVLHSIRPQGKMSSVVKMAQVVKSLDEADRLPLCPDFLRTQETYLSLRNVGRLVINKIFQTRGNFTQHALIHEIGQIISRAVRSQYGRGLLVASPFADVMVQPL